MSRLRFPLISDHLLLQPENEENLWNEKWTISLRGGENEQIGTLTFEGARVAGEVPISVELEPQYRNMGYGTEIFYFMAKFVFRFRNLREINAVCEHVNDKCVHALEKAGYVFREHREGMDHYSMKRAKTAWSGLYVSVGVTAGFIMGLVFGNLWIGTFVGVFAGAVLGFILDENDKKSHKTAKTFGKSTD